MEKKYFGIVGLGVVGKSMLTFYQKYPEDFVQVLSKITSSDPEVFSWEVRLFEERILNEVEQAMVQDTKTVVFGSGAWESFVSHIDLAWFSTGIDTEKYYLVPEKIIKEVDLFSYFWKMPILTVTGTIGKTTLTQLLYELFSLDSCALRDISLEKACTHARGCSYKRMTLGGNIGVGLLDLVQHQPLYQGAVLELSSWQLERAQSIRPTIGIWTNLYENHLDRHKTMAEYFAAKSIFLRNQKEADWGLLGASLINDTNRLFFIEHRSFWKGNILIVFDRMPTEQEVIFMQQYRCSFVYIEEDHIILQTYLGERIIFCSTSIIPEQGFVDSWLFALTSLYFFGVNLAWLDRTLLQEAYDRCIKAIGQHRLEYCAEKKGIHFYNDSKATIVTATEVAVEQILKKHQSVILIVGGTSKGADRSSLLHLSDKHAAIKKILRFGPGSADLAPLPYYENLELAVEDAIAQAVPGDAILFSPSGASYDLYTNYKERGKAFVRLVQAL
jgi:UDP-N-acetylmuramoylalanine--D-glutamate ligase